MVGRISLRRGMAMLLLPLSLAPVAVGAPAMVRAPAVLVRQVKRIVLSEAPAAARHGSQEPGRYPPGAARLERDVFAPVAGPLTPQVGVSVMAEHQTPEEKAHAPILLITGEPVGVARLGLRTAHGLRTIRGDR